MSGGQWYALLADAVLVVHLLLILFVIGGLAVTVIGWFRTWAWVRNFWFRLLHLAAIATVVVQSWLGAACPLTVWENRLRDLAGREPYGEAFIQHWLHRLIFYQAENWVFGLVYTLFGLLVVLALVLVPPRLPGR
jgi:polyferredoxin